MRTFLFSLLLISLSQCSQKPDNEELLLVVEFSRHGARTPGVIYDFTENPSDNFKSSDKSLTPQGREMHYNRGLELRGKYVDTKNFLNPVFDPSEIYIQSTY